MKTWKTENPPKDGTSIVAIGCVVSTNQASGEVAPFLLSVFWKVDGAFKGWRYRPFEDHNSPCDGLAVADSPSDEVRIDFWIECPTFNLSGRRPVSS